jgi:WD40 repeat protein
MLHTRKTTRAFSLLHTTYRSFGDVPIPTPNVSILNQDQNTKMAQVYRTQQQMHLKYVQHLSKKTPHIPSTCQTTLEEADITNVVSLEDHDQTQNLLMIATVHYKKGEIAIWDLKDGQKKLKKFATGAYRMEYGWHMVKFFDQDYLLCSYPYPGFKVINWKTGVLESNIDAIQPAPLSEAAKHGMLGFGTDYVVLGCRDGSVTFYNRTTKELIKTVSNLHTNYVRSLQFLPTNGLLVTAGLDGLVRLIDFETGNVVKTLSKGHTHWVSSIAVLDEKRIATSGGDKITRIWDVETGECIQMLTGHTGRINQVLPIGGSLVATCSDDKYIKIWDTNDGKCITTLKGHGDHVKSLVLLSDSRLISASLDGTLKIWQ